MEMLNDEKRSGPLDLTEGTALLEAHFPQLDASGKSIVIQEFQPSSATLRFEYANHLLRPGGTISVPAMCTLADVTVYVVLFTDRGEAARQAVTTPLNIDFRSRPHPGDLVARSTAEGRPPPVRRRSGPAFMCRRRVGDTRHRHRRHATTIEEVKYNHI